VYFQTVAKSKEKIGNELDSVEEKASNQGDKGAGRARIVA
jgi:hypothetical protein